MFPEGPNGRCLRLISLWLPINWRCYPRIYLHPVKTCLPPAPMIVREEQRNGYRAASVAI